MLMTRPVISDQIQREEDWREESGGQKWHGTAFSIPMTVWRCVRFAPALPAISNQPSYVSAPMQVLGLAGVIDNNSNGDENNQHA